MMTARERIMATINRDAVDRPPVDLWCTPEVLDSLREHTTIQDELEIYKELGVDKIVWIFPGYNGRFFDPNDSGEVTMWGVPTRMVNAGKATYQEYVNPPLENYTYPAQLESYSSWPDPGKFDYEGARALARKARAHGFATIGPWISHFEIYCQMRGLENALMDLIAEPEFLDAAIEKIDKVQTEMLHRFLRHLGDDIDIVFISDDMGMQHNMLIPLDCWERFFKPRLERWCGIIHSYGKKVLYHTDGSVLPMIPGLVECGVDILNPIQHVCPGMDLEVLKKKFGEKIIFHGGVENQNVLPMGTVEDVIAETEQCLHTLGKGGGYICCSCHNIQPGTPVENILAMIRTVKEHL